MTEIRIDGLKEIDEKLKAIPQKLAKRVLDKAMRAGGRVIRDKVKAAAPMRTGALKRNVIVKRGQRRFDGDLEARFIIGVLHGRVRTTPSTFKTKTGKVKTRGLTAYDKRGQDPFYFRFQELGYTAIGRARKGSRKERSFRAAGNPSYGRKIPGKKFMQNSLDASANMASQKVVAVAREEIEKGALK